MKYKVNFELIILGLIFITSLKIVIWKSIDPSTLSKIQQEEIGIGKVRNLNKQITEKKLVVNSKKVKTSYLQNN